MSSEATIEIMAKEKKTLSVTVASPVRARLCFAPAFGHMTSVF